MRKSFLALGLCSILCLGCDQVDQKTDVVKAKYTMGVLPPQSQALIDQEFEVYRKQNPDKDEATARRDFDIIQKMSAQITDPERATWAERRALARAWIKNNIENVYVAEEVPEEMIQQAIDAYAFQSGHPALVTASHILIHVDRPHPADAATNPEADVWQPGTVRNTPEAIAAKDALERVRQKLLSLETIQDEDLRHEAIRLTHAGFKTNMDADLTFPQYPIQPFMGLKSGNHESVVQEFADAAFALSADKPLSEVTETQFGYHLVLFKSKTDGVKAKLPDDRQFIVDNIVKRGRTIATEQKITELMQDNDKQQILYDDARLQEIVARGRKAQNTSTDSSSYDTTAP
jgi:hypothetical protein